MIAGSIAQSPFPIVRQYYSFMSSPNKPVLIFQGGWDGHQPVQCAELIAGKLTDRGLQVEVVDSLTCLEDEAKLKSYALIVPLWTCGTLTGPQENNLVNAVISGVGIAGFNGGMGDAFRGSINYQWMTGGQFLGHPGQHQGLYHQNRGSGRPDYEGYPRLQSVQRAILYAG